MENQMENEMEATVYRVIWDVIIILSPYNGGSNGKAENGNPRSL